MKLSDKNQEKLEGILCLIACAIVAIFVWPDLVNWWNDLIWIGFNFK